MPSDKSYSASFSKFDRPLILTDTGEPYADEWVYVEVCEWASTADAAREWAEGAFLNTDGDEVPATGCPVHRVSLRPEKPEWWTEAAQGDPDARDFWAVDVSLLEQSDD